MNIGYKAFTLIEILIVIIIIGILATALFPKLKGMQDKARYARVSKDMNDFRAALFLAQANTNSLSCDITLSGCSDCVCRVNGLDLRTISSGHSCRTTRITSLRKIEQAAGLDAGSLRGLETDPWGSPYMFDENEGRCYSPAADPCSHKDRIAIVGPDGLYNVGNINLQSLDDKLYEFPSSRCSDAY